MIEQAKDVYRWLVAYKDGTYLGEYDHPNGLGWAEIGDKPVKAVWLLRSDPNADYGHRVDLPRGATPVFFRRRSIELRLDDEQQIARPAIHCIGWKQGEQAIYLFVFEDGSTLLSTDLQAV